jgi:hypothetical protein
MGPKEEEEEEAVILLFSIIFVFLWYVGLYLSAQNHFQEEYNLGSASEVSYANICVEQNM